MANKNDINFEETIQKVESAIDKLQSGTIGLDESLKEFQESVELINKLQHKLDKTKLQVQEIIKKGKDISFENIEE